MAAVLAVFVILIAAGGATYYYLRRAAPEPAPAVAPPQTAPAAPAVAPPARVALPPLETSDGFVREQLAGLGGEEWRGWLASDGLARRFAAAVYALSDGKSPRKAVERPFLSGRFAVVEDGDRTVIDPSSYARYDRIAAVFTAIDPDQARATYRLLHPLLDEAWAEIGPPDTPLDTALGRAIDNLLAAPEVPAGPEVLLHEGLYRYADPALEAATPAQKNLMRMGPENAAKVRAALRRLRLALG
jgi:hypothetical protein